MSNELEKSAGVSHPMVLIQAMIDKGTDPEAIKKWMDLCERWDANQAKKAFAEAMTGCQQKMPTVVRDKLNTDTQKMYAPLETIKTYAKPIYTESGFSLSFTAEPGTVAGLTTVHLDVTHLGGHTKRTTLPNVPLDDKGPKGGATKNQIQALMSSMSYAQGRLICLAFNITVADEDRDGQHASPTIGPDEIRTINGLLDDCREAGIEVNYEKFLAWLTPRGSNPKEPPPPIENLEGVLASDFTKAVAFLTDRVRKAKREADKAKEAE